jgi:O-antigen/teichoic acid export membrane protein
MTLGSLGVWLGAPYLLHGIFGTDLGSAIGPLRILTAALPLMFLNTVLFYVFVAAQRREVYLGALTFGVAAGAILSFVLASRYGAPGGAWADFGRELLVSLVYFAHLLRTDLGRVVGRVLLRIVLASSAFTGVLILIAGVGAAEIAWPVAWNLLVLAGTLVFLGLPKIHEFLLLTDDRI